MDIRAQAFDGLERVIDPELGIDIVNLGLVYDVTVADEEIVVTMTMTTPACPLQPFFQQAVPAAVKKATGRDHVRLVVTFDPVWTPDKMTEKGKMFMRMMR